MVRRFRRRSNGTWLATLGTQLEISGEDFLSGFGIQLDNPSPYGGESGNQIALAISPLTTDAPTDGDIIEGTTTMSDVIGNEYFLDRVVGKMFISHSPSSSAEGPIGPILVGAGMFVARADDVVPGRPVGATNAQERNDNYSPLEWDTIREPWLWRRVWLLGGAFPGAQPNLLGGASNWDKWPAANWLYGSMADGPHFDQKTKRRVGQDDRLWFAFTTAYPPTYLDDLVGPVVAQGATRVYLDYRLHGSLRKARPTGRF